MSKRRLFKISFVVAIVFAAIFSFGYIFNYNARSALFADETYVYDNLTYLSIGDSIPAGYDLAGYLGGDENYDFVDNSFPKQFSDGLNNDKETEHYSASNWVKYNLTSGELATLLSSNLSLEENKKLQEADVITLSVGLNDVLNILNGYFENQSSIDEQISSTLQTFSSNYSTILSKLMDYNPNARVICLNMYNPFKDFLKVESNITINYINGESELPQKILTVEKLHGFAEFCEQVICGQERSLNAAISKAVTNSNRKNIVCVDVKAAFNANVGNYSELVNCKVLSLVEQSKDGNIQVDLGGNNENASISSVFGYNPTATGHNKIAQELMQCVNNNFAVVNLKYNGGHDSSHLNRIYMLNKGDELNPANPVYEKHNFKGWCTDEDLQSPWDSINNVVYGDITLYAKYKQTFEVKFYYNYDNLDVFDTKTAEDGTPVEFPTDPSRDDYKFLGWFTEEGATNQWQQNQAVTQDMNLYAGWEKVVFTVRLDANGGSLGGTTTFKVNKGALMDTPNRQPTRNRYLFLGWYKEPEAINKWNFETDVVTQDMTLYAGWIEAVTVLIDDGGLNSYVYAKGTKISQIKAELPPKFGYVVYGLYQDASFTSEYDDDFGISGNNVRIYVKYASMVLDDSGSVLVQEFSPLTKDIHFHIDARAGWLVSWIVNSVEAESVTANGDERITFTYTPSQVGNFSISCNINNEAAYGENPCTVGIGYTEPYAIDISIVKVVNKDKYYLRVEDSKYYDPSRFVWFKTVDRFSTDYNIKIGVGVELDYTFGSDCNVCVKYMDSAEQEAILISNGVFVSVDNYVDTQIIVSIIVTVGVVALGVVTCIITIRRYKKFY